MVRLQILSLILGSECRLRRIHGNPSEYRPLFVNRDDSAVGRKQGAKVRSQCFTKWTVVIEILNIVTSAVIDPAVGTPALMRIEFNSAAATGWGICAPARFGNAIAAAPKQIHRANECDLVRTIFMARSISVQTESDYAPYRYMRPPIRSSWWLRFSRKLMSD